MSGVLGVVPIGLHWPTLDPFLFCAHHLDHYPAGNGNLGVDASSLLGRQIGSDFELKDGWRMYHGREVPGFPKHPHRGFETITLARRGFIDHSDSLGAAARFGEGDVQWMTAGRGVVHSEMFPLIHRDKNNPAELFQVWLNLPAQNKMADPYFTMYWREQLLHRVEADDRGRRTEIVVVAGDYQGVQGQEPPPDSWASREDARVQIWTIEMSGGAHWELPSAGPGLNRVLYFYAGESLEVEGRTVTPNHAIQLRSDRVHTLRASESQGCSLLLLEGRPIGEPVAQHGPFVMNTRAELQQAFRDYQRDEFGGWSWKQDDPVHGERGERFALHPDGRREVPPE